ncbi:Glycogen debranching enzyme-like protein [Candidatus Koribacter versatilis Ellin345]|uniref:Glycogen debranching enzyme-like protein n=1 Tax=Koribacter versatilis (strain Ellin345) TaxID=204669 RepID=Q1IUR9_KORVE|nr:glycogen debranching protein [Candidatus Koribacter versatilis]ABF39381.1 Glycogen debranching enzyme-like protein [Candidatus Koribacter versatilis Ellin345]
MRLLKSLPIACLLAALSHAQQPDFAPIAHFPLTTSPLTIHQRAQERLPFSVTGDTGAILGQQDGSFELWHFPDKVFAHVSIHAALKDYPVPIELNPLAATIDVAPDHTTITYSHAAITVKQHMFLARGLQDAPAPLVMFEIESIRPVTLTIDLDPVMQHMWPALNGNRPGAGWIPMGTGGAYMLETEDPSFYGMIAMPNAQPGIMAPYQERPKDYPLQFILSYDPQRDGNKYFPLLTHVVDGGTLRGQERTSQLTSEIAEIAANLPKYYGASRDYYAHFFDTHLTVETPDPLFDQALRWAEISIDQLKVRKGNEVGLVAGVYPSADSDRPGFGWFFGRDSLWTTFALHSEGDFATSRNALEFLIARQRADGKIMHEYSQSADRVDWPSFPYMYAAADATPLFILAMHDYLRTTGDDAFIQKHWKNIKRAYDFLRAHDSDGDGIYDNSQGTGWVESWPPGMPQQELYLAALDQQATAAIGDLAKTLGDDTLTKSAHDTAESIRTKLNAYLAPDGIYAFSRNKDGSYDTTPTSYPAVAWWTGELALPNAAKTLDFYAASDLNADWGSRAIAQSNQLYDPISYHQGSIWPLFTGWTAMAEFRAGRSLAGLQHLRENLRLTWEGDPGNVTELMSGKFNEPLGRSTAHQLWSSAMVLTPAIRGLFGIETNVSQHKLFVVPQLPPEWPRAVVHHVPYGDTELDITYQRQGTTLNITVTSAKAIPLCVIPERTDRMCKVAPATTHTASITLPDVQVSLPDEAPRPGDASHLLRVINQQYEGRKLALTLEAPAGSHQQLPLQMNDPRVKTVTAQGATINKETLEVAFPTGEGFQRQIVTLTW